ncbi:MAG: hypothetical protein ACYCZX_16810, partial [Rhodospirillaceae bacterium]
MVFYDDAGAQKTVRARADFALLNMAGRRRPLELDMRLAELTSFYTVFSFHMPFATLANASTVDAALAAGSKDFCLIQNAGHVFYGYDPLSFAVREAMDKCRFVTANVQADGTLDPNCLLINRRTWEDLGRPRFGVERGGIVMPTGHAPQAWDEAVTRSTWTCRTDGDVFAWLAALDDVTAAEPQDEVIEATLGFLRNVPDREGAPKKIFVFNSENDADLPNLRYRPGLDTAFVLASGFKTNRILETLGFHDRTKIVVYDYSAPALMLRRMMVEEWDGRDFAGFFATARPRIDAAFPAGVGYLPGPMLKDKELVAGEFQREAASVFTTEQHWLAHWERYRKLPHVYVEVDVITDRSGARAMISGHGQGAAVMWMSDMFN